MTDLHENVVENIPLHNETQDSEDEGRVDFSEASKKLTEGLLSIYQLPLEQVKKEINQLTTKQEALLSQMQEENKMLNETLEDINLNEMFNTIKVYQAKLVSINKDMTAIHERTVKLKKRAVRLQHLQQREAYNREQQREQEIRREQDLIGKPASS